MKSRCLSPANSSYVDYGGRGINVCERWKRSFLDFVIDMGERPSGMSIDRIDNNGNYEPLNCRWATDEEQRNNKRTSRFVTHNGRTLTLMQWSRVFGVNQRTLAYRLNKGDSAEKALGPIRLRKPNTPQLTFNGKTHSMKEWESIIGAERGVISMRLKRGWSTEKILTTPVRERKSA